MLQLQKQAEDKNLIGLWNCRLYQPYSILEMFKFDTGWWSSFFVALERCAFGTENLNDVISDEGKRKLLFTLSQLARECKEMGLNTSSRYLERVASDFNIMPNSKIQAELKHLSIIPSVIHSEMSLREVFILSLDDSEIFKNKSPFGDEVHAHFPSASYDIKEATKCLALDRNTACVMHLMRALEFALSELAKDLGIHEERPGMDTLIKEIRRKLKEIESGPKPNNWRDLRQNYSEFLERAHNFCERFQLVKDGFRNDAMHFREYGREQAKDMYNHAKGFMGFLAKHWRESDTA